MAGTKGPEPCVVESLLNSATIEEMASKPRIKWKRDSPGVIPLWIADPDFHVAPEIKEVLIRAVEEERLFYDDDVEAREAMAEKIRRRNNLEASAEDILITQGVLPTFWLAVQYSCKPGDEVVVTDPMYYPFYRAVEMTGTKPLYWPLEMEEGYRFDVERLKELITPRTSLIFVCNPHNPCGRVMTEEELRGIGEVAVDHGMTILVDELWEDIVFDDRRHITLASLSPEIEERTMTVWGFSKTYGVAGLQMGYLCATNREMMEELRSLSRGLLRGTSTLSRAAARMMLDGTLEWWRKAVMRHLHQIRAICERRFRELSGVECPKLEGTYLMFPRFDYDMSSEELEEYLRKEAALSFTAGSHFGSRGEGHLRMCIATSEAIMDEVFNRLERALEKLR
jgi:aspartate/methionine/tyrosine aminotransferase